MNNQNDSNNQNKNSFQYWKNNNNLNQLQNQYNDLKQLDEMYRKGMKSQRRGKNKKFFAASILAAAAVTTVVVPIVIYQKKGAYRYEIVVQSDAEDFESYSVTIARSSSISDLKLQLNQLEGHNLIGVYKDQECTILYDDAEKVSKDTTVYLKFEKQRYSISIPTSELYTVEYSSSVDPNSIEWDERFIFWLTLNDSCDTNSVSVYEGDSSIPLDIKDGRYCIIVSADTSIRVEANIKKYNISIPEDVVVRDENGNTILNNSQIEHGTRITVTYSEDEGNKKDKFTINGNNQINGVTITVEDDITIEYTQIQLTYQIVLPTDMTGYEIKQTSAYADLDKLYYNSEYTFRINLKSSHDESTPKIYVNNKELTPNNEGVYTININNEQSYWSNTGIFEIKVDGVDINTYTVSANTEHGYEIQNLPATVEHGQGFTFNIALEPSHNKSTPTVIVEGATLSKTTSRDGDTITYTVTDAVDAINISIAGVDINTYKITAPTWSEAYNISGLPESIKYGTTVEFTLTPTDAYDDGEPTFSDCNATITKKEYDESTNTYTYEISNPTGAIDLTISIPKNKYEVTFKNGNKILSTTIVDHGETTLYNGETPTRADENGYTYTFTGWDKELTTITGDTTFTAQFSEERIEYTISYEQQTGSTITITNNGGSGDIAPDGKAYMNDVLEINIAPNDGSYEISDINVTGATDNGDGTYTVTGNVEISYICTQVGQQITVFVDDEEKTAYVKESTVLDAMAELGYNYENTCGFFTDGSFVQPLDADMAITANMEIYTRTVTDAMKACLEFTLNEDGQSYSVDGKEDSYGLMIEEELLGSDCTIVIPAEYEGLPVTVIAEAAFNWGSELVNITLSVGITTINNSAFVNCKKLTSINIVNGITTVGANAFGHCEVLKEVYIPKSVISFSTNGSLFQRCYLLEKIVVDEDNDYYTSRDSSGKECNVLISKADNHLISGCKTSEIPDGVKTIGALAFAGCIGLESISLPNTVTEIGTNAFRDCTALAEINMSTSVTLINNWAFAGCSSLTSIDLPEGLDKIEQSAFEDTGLTSIHIPSTVTYISWHIIGGCDSLQSATFGETEGWYIYGSALTEPNKRRYLSSDELADESTSTQYLKTTYCGSYIWYRTENAVTVTINVDGVDKLAWLESGKNIRSALGDWGYNYEKTCGFFTDDTFTTAYADDATITEGTTIYTKMVTLDKLNFTAIDSDKAYSVGAKLNDEGEIDTTISGDIVIPKQYNGKPVTTIAANGFKNCANMETVTLPSSVTSIGLGAFYMDLLLNSINIPNSVTSIGERAFYQCYALTSITIPASVTSIGDKAFYYCTSLGSVEFEENSKLISIGYSAFANCVGLTSITIPASVTSISVQAFYYCNSLGSVEFEENSQLRSICDWAFRCCYKLTRITIPASVTSIGEGVLSCCSALTSIVVETGNTYYYSENNALIHKTTKTLIAVCKDTTIIPEDVTRIGDFAFDGCDGLTKITIPDKVTSIGDHAFDGCAGLNSITFANNSQLTSIGYYAFQNTGLTSITIPASVTSIGNWAFARCSRLANITIPASVTSIGNYAFSHCSGLTSIAIPAGVTSIGASAFNGCGGLTSITFNDTSTWYRTNSSTDWGNKTGGTKTTVTNATTNATYFTNTYKGYYWYKL